MIFNDKKYIANKIKEYRLKSKLTQGELAERVDMSTKQISRIEVGDFYPSLRTFFKIVEVLNIDLNDFAVKIPLEKSNIRKKLILMLYESSEDELKFYERLITFAKDEVAEIKKNIFMKNFR